MTTEQLFNPEWFDRLLRVAPGTMTLRLFTSDPPAPVNHPGMPSWTRWDDDDDDWEREAMRWTPPRRASRSGWRRT
jgi:hypothetical protein